MFILVFVKVSDLFVTILGVKPSSEAASNASSSSSSVSTSLFVARKARELEAAINDLHPQDSSSKAYAAKARTLAFNLKRNKVSFLWEREIGGSVEHSSQIAYYIS